VGYAADAVPPPISIAMEKQKLAENKLTLPSRCLLFIALIRNANAKKFIQFAFIKPIFYTNRVNDDKHALVH
jgi:hypothetical protein